MAEIRQSLKDFVLNFSSHGFQRVFYPVGNEPTIVSKLFRVIWFFAWGGASLAMIYQIVDIFDQYFMYGKTTTISFTKGSVYSVPRRYYLQPKSPRAKPLFYLDQKL